jgi:hypothetical protein
VCSSDLGVRLAIPSGTREAYLEKNPSWRVVPSLSSRDGKRPNVSGPLDDIQLHPTLVIYGTQVPAETETNRLVAQWHAGVNPRTDISFPVKADTEVTDAELKSHSVILVGRPETNSVTARAGLPVAFGEGSLRLHNKEHRGEAPGISIIQPSPWSDSEYVVLHAGTDFRGTLASRNLPEMSPDYLIYDAPSMTVQVGLTLLDRRKVLDGGFFDQRWR